MINPYSSNDLRAALELIDQLAVPADARETFSLTVRIDSWLSFDETINLPDGLTYVETGHRLGVCEDGRLWLLPGGRLLLLPSEPYTPCTERALLEADTDTECLAEHLRNVALSEYLDETFDALTPQTVPVVARDLFELVPSLLPRSRAFVLRALAGAMRPGEGWNTAVARLRTGFERSLADHDPEVVAISAGALVRLAAGLGPLPPTGDPRRGVIVMFVSPRAEVRLAALDAMNRLPTEATSGLVEVCAEQLDQCLAASEPEVRRLAGSVLRRAHSGGPASEVVTSVDSPIPAERRRVLEHLAEMEDDRIAMLLAPAIQALSDDDRAVRDAAHGALTDAASRPAVRQQVYVGLLSSTQPEAIDLGLSLVEAGGEPSHDAVVDSLSAVLASITASERVRAAELLADAFTATEPEAAVEGYEVLVRHEDAEVRRVALRRIAGDVVDRISVREALFPVLMEHMHDPHPELRVETALTVIELRYPHAASIAAQLAYDPDGLVRSSLAHVVARSGDAEAHDQVARVVGLVDTLFDFASLGTGDDRVRWKAALDTIMEKPNTRTRDLLVALLAAAPDDVSDPFVQFAVDEIDSHLLGLLPEGDALVTLCRRLVQPPGRQVKHAARLAGVRAAYDPLAFDFLWTLYTAGEPLDRKVARRQLAAMASGNKSDAVAETIADLARTTRNAAERDLLNTLLNITKGS